LKGDTPTVLESLPLLRETLLRPRATKLLSGGEEYCSSEAVIDSGALTVLGLAVIDSNALAVLGLAVIKLGVLGLAVNDALGCAGNKFLGV
jgi:hypothetical protein